MTPPKLGRPPRRSEETTRRLRSDIAEGRFDGSETLPGERQLAEILQVSRTTLRRALADLVAEGVLVQRQGLGTAINRTLEPEQPLDTSAVFTALGYSTSGIINSITAVRDLWRGFDAAHPDEAMALAAAPGQTVYRSVRMLLSEDRPVAIESQVAPHRFLQGPGPKSGSLIDALAFGEDGPTDVIIRLRAVSLTADEAGALDIDRATPAVSLQKAIYLADGRCCAFTRTLYPLSVLDLVAVGRLS